MKSEKSASTMKKVGTVLGALGFAAVMAFALSPWVKGQVFGMAWKLFGNDTFTCGGDWTVNISGKSLESDGTLVSAGGNCTITLTDCHLKGAQTISSGGSAVVIIEGGTIEGSEVAVDAAGGGLEIRDATIRGGKVGLQFHGSRSESATVHNTTIEGETAVKASSGGTLTFVDSKITGSEVAVDASSGSAVDLGNAQVTGRVEVRGDATVTPTPGGDAPEG